MIYLYASLCLVSALCLVLALCLGFSILQRTQLALCYNLCYIAAWPACVIYNLTEETAVVCVLV